jgi:hypothetical protein
VRRTPEGQVLELRLRERAGIKFCGECGMPLAEPTKPGPPPDPRSYTPKHLAQKILTTRSALEGERKQVTVLFADVKGSMDWAEPRPDPTARYLVYRTG